MGAKWNSPGFGRLPEKEATALPHLFPGVGRPFQADVADGVADFEAVSVSLERLTYEIGPGICACTPWSPRKGSYVTRVKLTIMDGDLKGKELRCDGYTRCLIGRRGLRYPAATDSCTRHFTPSLCAGSRAAACPGPRSRQPEWNVCERGLIGQRPKVKRAHVEAPPVCAERELEDGDQIRVEPCSQF